MLIKVWFGLVSAILFGTLVALVANFSILNMLHWIMIIILVIAVILTILVYLENPLKKKNNTDLQKTYAEFLKQKDRQIEELQKKSNVILKTAMKREEVSVELQELKRKLEAKKD